MNMQFTFTGTAVTLCCNTYVYVYVDDAIGRFSVCNEVYGHPHCTAFPEGTWELYCGDLAQSTYTAILEFFGGPLPPGQDSFNFYGGVITYDIPAISDAVWIDDRDPKWQYRAEPYATPGASWSNGSFAGDYKQTHTYTCNWGDSAIYNFTDAYAMQLLGIVNYNSTIYSVTLYQETTTEGISALYNGSNLWLSTNQTLFTASGLEPSLTYSLAIMNYNISQPWRTGTEANYGCLFLDALVLYTSAPDNATSVHSLGASSASPTRTIVGIVIGVLVLVAALASYGIWAWRKASKRSEHAVRRATAETAETVLRQVPQPFFNHYGDDGASPLRTKGRPTISYAAPDIEAPAPAPEATPELNGRMEDAVGSDHSLLPVFDWEYDGEAPPEYTSDRARSETEEEDGTVVAEGVGPGISSAVDAEM